MYWNESHHARPHFHARYAGQAASIDLVETRPLRESRSRARGADQERHNIPRDTARSMSQENVEIVRRVYEAAAERDPGTIFALYDRGVELDASRLGMFSSPFKGHDGLRQLFRDWHEAWGEIEYSYEELIDAGDDSVISVVSRHARGRGSGAEVERPFALLWTVRDKRIVRVVWFLTREDAYEAAGLSD